MPPSSLITLLRDGAGGTVAAEVACETDARFAMSSSRASMTVPGVATTHVVPTHIAALRITAIGFAFPLTGNVRSAASVRASNTAQRLP